MISSTSISPELAIESLRQADRLVARALDVLATSDVEGSTALSPEMFLQLHGGITRTDARMYVHAAHVLRRLPITRAGFAAGRLSWGAVRAIVLAMRSVSVGDHAAIDDVVAANDGADPDLIIERVNARIDELREDLATRRETRRVASAFLAIQGRFDGSATFYGEADAESAATITTALDAVAKRPRADEDAPSRAQQRMQAFVSICEASLDGEHTTRPRPRFIVTVDAARPDAGELLWSIAGRPARLTPLSTDVLSCDASWVSVPFDGGRPIAVGDASAPITNAMRTALIARDRGCRFPGCSAPIAWTDAHHAVPRENGGPTEVSNLVLLCRKCHRRVHRYRWRLDLRDDGAIRFSRRGTTHVSRARRE